MKFKLTMILASIAMFAFVAFSLLQTDKATASTFSNNGVMVQNFVYSFAVDGGTTSFKNLKGKIPVGAQILRVHYKMDTAFVSDGSATIALGDADTGNRYLTATAFDNAAFDDEKIAIISSGVPFNVASANKGEVGVTIAGSGVTAGKMQIFVEYVMPKQ